MGKDDARAVEPEPERAGDDRSELPPAPPVESAEPPADAAAAAPAVAAEPAAAGETVEALRDRWLRTEAELQNFRRRARRDVEETRRAAEDAALLELVSFLDDLERALDAAAAAGAPPAWADGVRLVVSRMSDHLARHRVESMEPLGQRFDPALHEAVLEMDAPEGVTPGAVLNVVRKGYLRDGRALRAARVVVARAPQAGPA